jgi:hypothetical protein
MSTLVPMIGKGSHQEIHAGYPDQIQTEPKESIIAQCSLHYASGSHQDGKTTLSQKLS